MTIVLTVITLLMALMSNDHVVLVDGSLFVGVVNNAAPDDSDILVDSALDILVNCSLVVGVVDHVLDVVVNVALDDLGLHDGRGHDVLVDT